MFVGNRVIIKYLVHIFIVNFFSIISFYNKHFLETEKDLKHYGPYCTYCCVIHNIFITNFQNDFNYFLPSLLFVLVQMQYPQQKKGQCIHSIRCFADDAINMIVFYMVYFAILILLDKSKSFYFFLIYSPIFLELD